LGEKLQFVGFRKTVKLPEEQAVFVQRGVVQLPCYCVRDKLSMSILNRDLLFLLARAPILSLPLANHLLRSLPVTETLVATSPTFGSPMMTPNKDIKQF
jgi:hypothetical protein